MFIILNADSNSGFESPVLLLRSDDANRLKYPGELELQATWTIEPPSCSKLPGAKIFMAVGALLGHFQTRSGVVLLGASLDFHLS